MQCDDKPQEKRQKEQLKSKIVFERLMHHRSFSVIGGPAVLAMASDARGGGRSADAAPGEASRLGSGIATGTTRCASAAAAASLGLAIAAAGAAGEGALDDADSAAAVGMSIRRLSESQPSPACPNAARMSSSVAGASRRGVAWPVAAPASSTLALSIMALPNDSASLVVSGTVSATVHDASPRSRDSSSPPPRPRPIQPARTATHAITESATRHTATSSSGSPTRANVVSDGAAAAAADSVVALGAAEVAVALGEIDVVAVVVEVGANDVVAVAAAADNVPAEAVVDEARAGEVAGETAVVLCGEPSEVVALAAVVGICEVAETRDAVVVGEEVGVRDVTGTVVGTRDVVGASTVVVMRDVVGAGNADVVGDGDVPRRVEVVGFGEVVGIVVVVVTRGGVTVTLRDGVTVHDALAHLEKRAHTNGSGVEHACHSAASATGS
jgi:hypothetical protein